MLENARLVGLALRRKGTLHDAVSRGNARDVQFLLKNGRSVHERDACGWTPLMLAARDGHVDVVGELIRHCANVDEKSDSGATALTLAARNGHLQVAVLLIRSGADVDAKDNQGRTALSHAAELDHREVGERLLRNGASIACRDVKRKTPLHYCAERTGREMLTALLRHSAQPASNQTISSPSSDNGVVALFVAAAVGDHQSLETLIAEGISVVNAKTSVGRTPLFYAAEFGHLEMVQVLIDNGASVTVKPSATHSRQECDTPLTLAGRAGHMKVFRVLVEAGASVNVRGGDEVAIGLKYLHGQNVVHNDLKCDNILIGVDGKAKLIDFGLSCIVNEAEIEIEVKNMGAVHWKAPEYLEGNRPSFESDVYSFAMCILEAVTGDVPWGSNMPPASVR